MGGIPEFALAMEPTLPLLEPTLLEKTYALQAELCSAIAAGKLPEAQCPLLHTFSKGAYARSIFIPAGSMLVGKTHRHEHLLIMSDGDVSITTDEGIQRLVGFNALNSMAGIKRAVYAHADTIITTIHLTDETDLAKIEEDVIIPEPRPLIEGEGA